MLQRAVKTILLFAVAVFGASGQLSADESPIELLAHMALAMKTTSYRGQLVYAHGKRLDSLDIMHRAADGREQERLVSLNGDRYEIYRDGKMVVRMQPDQNLVQVTQNFKDRSLILSLPDGNLKDSKHYRVTAHGNDRIADLDSRIVSILPLDEYRYGYRIWIADQLRLPLKMELLSPVGKLLESVMFTQIERVSNLDLDKYRPVLDDAKLTSKTELFRGAKATRWRFRNLPDGFAVEGQRSYQMQKHKNTTVHFLVSDGMAVVSVYIEQMKHQQPMHGGNNMGAVNTFGLDREGYQIMAIGEVPGKTVKRIAESVHLTQAIDTND